MADLIDQLGFDKPSTAVTPKKDETEIHVIPDQFYGEAMNLKSAPKKIEAAPSIVPPVAPPLPNVFPPQPLKSAALQPRKNNSLLIVAIIVLTLALVAGAIYYFVFAPKAPVCGNGICEAAESYKICPKDCPAPPPVCGDNLCEKPENFRTCSKDCEPPPPICGDGTCDTNESYDSCPKDCPAPPPVCGDGKCEQDRGEGYESCPTDCPSPAPKPAPDADNDGLSDVEETTIYGSNPNRVDSDGDSFVDLNEVLNLFDPSKLKPAKLIDNPGITLYRNQELGVQLFRPTVWTVQDMVTENATRFSVASGEFVQLTTYQKSAGQTLAEWLASSPIQNISTAGFELVANKKGYEQAASPDGQTMFLDFGNRVVELNYNLGGQLEIRYRVTFSMMINSFEFIKVTPTPAPTNKTS